MMLFDTHAHLLDERFQKDRDEVIKEVDRVVCIFSPDEDMEVFKKLLEKENVSGACGIHPHDAKDAIIKQNPSNANNEKEERGKWKEERNPSNGEKMWDELHRGLSLKKIVALGEIGLDFYYDNSPKDIQKEVFNRQLKIAREKNLPVIVHSRAAFKETLEVLKKTENEEVLFHCFSGDIDDMRKIISLGYYISVAGVLTFPNAFTLREVVGRVPMEKLLAETDSPYLAPQPVRGKRNKPLYVKYVIEQIADIKGMDFIETAEILAQNAKNFFKN